MSAKRIKDTTQAVQRSIDILEAVASIDGSIGVSSLARQIGLSKATTYRLCQTLVDRQFLEQSTQTGEYHLGARLLRMSSRLLGGMSLAQMARPVLDQLAVTCRQNAFVGMLEDMQELLICEEVRFDNPVQPRPLLGARFNLLDAPGGLLCLAGCEQGRLDSLLPSLLRRVGRTDTNHLKEFGEKIRALRGAAFVVQEGVPSRSTVVISCLVTDRRSQIVGVIGCCCPQLLHEPVEREPLIEACCQASRTLSVVLPIR